MKRGLLHAASGAIIAGALLFAPPAAAREGALHALYVGVADYKYGAPEGSALTDLEGAPNDIATIRGALEARANFDSVTVLRDADAGRDAILAALDAFATGSKGAPGETLVFYYTGHGARAVDMGGSQASSFHSTLVPWDARNPELLRRRVSGDILDTELRDRLDAITARGINVVTIFDSCNSGTATRNAGHAKSAPDEPIPAAVSRMAVAGTDSGKAVAPGYRVHLAAAVDNSEAFENQDGEGKWRSDFTVALAQAVTAAPSGASYREIFDAAKAMVDGQQKGQRPRTEGAVLTPFLAPRLKTDRLFAVDADPASGKLSLQGGTLSLVAPGARFALYGSIAAANRADEAPLAVATVVESGIATAALDVALPQAGETLVAREIAAAPSSAPLSFAVEKGAALSDLTRASIDQRPNLKSGGSAAYRLVPVMEKVAQTDGKPKVIPTGDMGIVRQDGSPVATLPSGAALAEALDRIARHDALRAMAGKGEGIDLQPAFATTRCDGSTPLTFDFDGGTARTSVGQPVRLIVTNPLPDDPLYLYVLYLAADYAIYQMEPAPFAEPVPWPGGACAEVRITPDKPGTQRLLVIGSTVPLPGTSMLQQAGLLELGAEVAQVAAAEGNRSAAAWAVRSLDVIVN